MDILVPKRVIMIKLLYFSKRRWQLYGVNSQFPVLGSQRHHVSPRASFMSGSSGSFPTLGSVLNLRPPGFEVRILCLENSVIWLSSRHPQELLLAQFSLYVHKSGLSSQSFNFLVKHVKMCDWFPYYELVYQILRLAGYLSGVVIISQSPQLQVLLSCVLDYTLSSPVTYYATLKMFTNSCHRSRRLCSAMKVYFTQWSTFTKESCEYQSISLCKDLAALYWSLYHWKWF